MELIIGGAFQGKLTYALAYTGYEEEMAADGLLNGLPVINHLHHFIRNRLLEGGSPKEEIMAYLAEHPDTILICDEVGCGIVPLQEFERRYREEVGRICCLIAGQAVRVHRVHCGIGRMIKDD